MASPLAPRSSCVRNILFVQEVMDCGNPPLCDPTLKVLEQTKPSARGKMKDRCIFLGGTSIPDVRWSGNNPGFDR